MLDSQVYSTMKSPLGEIVLTACNEGLTGLYLPTQTKSLNLKLSYDTKPFKQVFTQLAEYFEKRRQIFDLPLAAIGTTFQMQVWKALSKIKHGQTKSYGEIAKTIHHPLASRAVGAAIGKNPLGIIVPCHRVIGANGKLTGFAGGIEAKQWLLQHETA